MRFFMIVLMLVWSTVAYAETKLVAVLEFRGESIDPQIMMQLSEASRGGARSALPNSEYNITSRESMKSMLEDMGKDLSACNVECEVELGRVLQSDYVISGTVGKIDNMYILTLKLHDTLSGSLMGQKTIRNTDKFVLLDSTGPETKALVVKNISLASNQLTGKKVNVTFKSKEFDKEFGDNTTMIMVGGTPVGNCDSTPCSLPVPSGRFDVQFIKKGYTPETRTLELEDNKTYTVSLRASFARLSLETVPQRVNIEITGPEGFNTVEKDRFDNLILDTPGKYTATVKDDCYVESGKYITINPGDVREQQLTLQHRMAGVNIYALNEFGEPIPAEIYIDGEKKGIAPWQGTIPLCSDELLIKYNRSKKSVRLKKKGLKEEQIKTLPITVQ